MSKGRRFVSRSSEVWVRFKSHPRVAWMIALATAIGLIGDASVTLEWLQTIVLFLSSRPATAVVVVFGLLYIFQDSWLPPVSRWWERTRQKHHPLVLEYDESKHSVVCAEGRVKMVRLCVRNPDRRSIKNLMLTILEIEGPLEAREKYAPLVGRQLAVSRDPIGDHKGAWGNKPEDRVDVLHPGREAMFDFVRLTAGNFTFCHGSYVPGHPHQGIQRWDQQPSGVISRGKYKVRIAAQADDLKEVTGMFEFDSDMSFSRLAPCTPTSHK